VAATSSGWSGPIAGAAEVIEAIDAMAGSSVTSHTTGPQSQHGAVLLLFRRGSQQPPAPASQPQGEIVPDRQMAPTAVAATPKAQPADRVSVEERLSG
jgi:hypothetical protein